MKICTNICKIWTYLRVKTLTQIHYKILNISSDGEKHFLVYVCNKTLVQFIDGIVQKFIKNPYHVLSLIYFCVGLGSPKAALDVVNNELYCLLSCGGSSSGWWPGNAVGSLAKMKKNIYFFKYSFDHEFELNLNQLIKNLFWVWQWNKCNTW